MDDNDTQVDHFAAAIDVLDGQIRTAMSRKDAATASGNRVEYDKALADNSDLGDRRRLGEKEYQQAVAAADQAERAGKLAELEELRGKVDGLAAKIAEKRDDAKALAMAFRGHKSEARALAEE